MRSPEPPIAAPVVTTASANAGAATLLAAILLGLNACAARAPAPTATGNPAVAAARAPSAGALDAARLAAAASEPDQWFTPGRDASGAYYSPLADINAGNVARLGLAWDYHLGSYRGLEATPIVIDGVMYAVGNFGRVYVLDAASGRELWTYDPQIDGQWARYACCDAVNRGLAVWQGRVYGGALDGYLHALDAATGRLLWKVDTLPARGPKTPYTLSAAPVIAGNLVIVGSAGADFDGARGYVAAYDRDSGAFRWRFYTVPRDPKDGRQDQPHLVAALKSWDPHHQWESAGGGTVWDGISYDAELNLVYVGTANGAPYNIKQDGRQGGDDLYTAAIVAIHADTGQLAWYYQTTPGDRWDYDSTQKMILTTLDLGRGARKVIMQASKNGYYYVLDRATGELLSAHNFTFVNWARGIDPASGRPLVVPQADYQNGAKLLYPANAGAHSWQPMSYDPQTGLTYIPTIEWPMVYFDSARLRAGMIEGFFTVPAFPPEDYDPGALASLYGPLPPLSQLEQARAPATSRGYLRAWDPVHQRLAWEVPSRSNWDGGVLSTGGGLVFQGDGDGYLNVYAADSGKPLAQVLLGTGVMAAPMTYRIGATQYVAVMAGYGGDMVGYPLRAHYAAYDHDNEGRIIVLKLDGGAVPQPQRLPAVTFPAPPPQQATPPQIANGEVLYNRYCSRCHELGRGVLPDLRTLSAGLHAAFYDIVLDGALAAKGMARWDDVLSRDDAEAIHAYIVDESWKAYRAQRAAAH